MAAVVALAIVGTSRPMRAEAAMVATPDGWTQLAIAAHRGATTGRDVGHTEDTLGSYRTAVSLFEAEAQATGRPASQYFLEGDIRETRDNVPVILHDARVNRTTNGRGAVANLTWHQVGHLRTDLTPAPGRVPRLAAVARLASQSGVGFLPELKATHFTTAQLRHIAAILSRFHLAGRTVMQSFYADNLRAWHRVRSAAPGALLEKKPSPHVDGVKQFAGWVLLDQRASRAKLAAGIRHAKAADLHVGVWTPNGQGNWEWDVAHGVQMVITDQAQALTQLETAEADGNIARP